MNDRISDRSGIVKVFHALADGTRLKLIKKILIGPLSGSSCQMLSSGQNLSQPAISHHFKILVDAGIINQQKIGKAKFYQVNLKLLHDLGVDLNKLID